MTEKKIENCCASEELEQYKAHVDVSVFSQGPAVVFHWRNEEHWPVEFVSPNAVLVFGYSAAEFFEGRIQYAVIIHPDDLEQVVAEVAHFSESGATQFQHKDYRIVAKDGTVRWVEDHTQIIRNAENQITHYLGYVLDVSARKRAEERLVMSARFANVGMWDWNIVTGELHWSDRIGPLFGYEKGELETSYENFLQAVHPDDRKSVIAAVHNSVEKGADYNIEHRVVWPDGTVHWMHESGGVVRAEDGTALNMLGVVRDISERKQADEDLRQSEARFKDIAESMSDWIWEVDAQGVYTYCSGRVEDILGFRPDEIIGRTPFDFMSADEVEKIANIFSDIIAKKAPIKNLENWNIANDGRRVCLLTNGIPLFDDDGNLMGYRGVDSDITERKVAEEQLIQAKLTAETASQAKSEFLSRMSHELRTPMNAILGFTELMMEVDEDPLTDSQRESLGIIRGAGQHLLGLINEVLDLAKIDEGKLQLDYDDVDWRGVVGQCVELTQPSLDKQGLRLVDEISPDGPATVKADEMRLRQVLLNLLSNAVKYNRPQGSVTLRSSVDEAGLLRIAVMDTGDGLSEAQLADLFQPFNRLAKEVSSMEGVGIGLVISKRLMELMGGVIGVQCVPGEGCTFWLELPIASD